MEFDDPQPLCTMCRKPAGFSCHRCRDPYCSSMCQQQDWPQHKVTCFPMPSLIKTASESAVRHLRPQYQNFGSEMRPPKQAMTYIKPNLPTDSNGKLTKEILNGSVFDNPFKRNSQNIGFQTNNVTKSIGEVNISFPETKMGKGQAPLSDKCPIRKLGTCIPTEPMRLPGQTAKVESVIAPQPKRNHSNDNTSMKVPSNQNIKQIEHPKKVPGTTTSPDITQSKKEDVKTNASIKVPAKPNTEQIEMSAPGKTDKVPKVEAAPQSKKDVAKTNASIEATSKPNTEHIEISAKVESVAPDINPHPKKGDSKTDNSIKVTSKPNPEEISQSQGHVSEIEPWMKPFLIEGKDFVTTIVQYTAENNIAWVMLEKNEAASNNLLREINKSASNAPTPAQNQITVNSLFRVQFEEIYYRAVILKPVSTNGTVLARLIDYGNELSVPISELKSSIPVMVNLNAFSFPIRFQQPRKIDIGDKLNIKMKSMKDDVMNVIVEGENPIFTMNDIDVIPIPSGKKLYCLDHESIETGYISASVFDSKALAHVEKFSSKITDYCTGSKDGYSPQADELCLSKYEDGQWYRAVVTKIVDSNTFEITFIDYGNTATVSTSDIRKIPEEYLYHCLMNKCYIKGFPKNPTKEDIRKLELFFNDNQIFEIETIEEENGAYVILPKY